MNKRIRELAEQATSYNNSDGWLFDKEKFAELIVAECLAQVAKVDDMLEDEPAQHAAVAWVASSIADHFGVARSQSDWDQAAAEFIAAEDKKVASRYGYFPKLHPSEWKD
jgi:hypothetical protein